MENISLIEILQTEDISSQGIITNRNNERVAKAINDLIFTNVQNKRHNIKVHSKDQHTELKVDNYTIKKKFKDNNTYNLLITNSTVGFDMALKDPIIINEGGYVMKEVATRRINNTLEIDITVLTQDFKFNLILI